MCVCVHIVCILSPPCQVSCFTLLYMMDVQMAAKDKSALQAQVASLHKENLDLTRGKKVLQAKVSVLVGWLEAQL